MKEKVRLSLLSSRFVRKIMQEHERVTFGRCELSEYVMSAGRRRKAGLTKPLYEHLLLEYSNKLFLDVASPNVFCHFAARLQVSKPR